MTHLLVPVDGSDPSLAALAFALDLYPSADVTVLTVAEVTALPDDPEMTPAEAAEQRAAETLSEAESVAADHDRSVETATVHGSVPTGIVEYAEEHGVDHVVMGSTGQTGLSRILLGSVAETVVRRAPVPVTVVR